MNTQTHQGCLVNRIKSHGIPSNSLQGKKFIRTVLYAVVCIEGQKTISHIHILQHNPGFPAWIIKDTAKKMRVNRLYIEVKTK